MAIYTHTVEMAATADGTDPIMEQAAKQMAERQLAEQLEAQGFPHGPITVEVRPPQCMTLSDGTEFWYAEVRASTISANQLKP